MDGRLRQPWSGMSSEQIRYEHRFAPFSNVLAPPVVSYCQYKEAEEQIESSQTVSDQFKTAYACFSQAKLLLEEIPEADDEVS